MEQRVVSAYAQKMYKHGGNPWKFVSQRLLNIFNCYIKVVLLGDRFLLECALVCNF